MEIWPSNQYGIETLGITSTYEDEKVEKDVLRTAFTRADPKSVKRY